MSDAARRTPRELLAERGELDDDVIAVRSRRGDRRSVHARRPRWPRSTPIRKGDPDALEVIRHSTSHVMAQAVQRLFPGTQVTIGPSIENGFYYDFDRPDGTFTDQDLLQDREGDAPHHRAEPAVSSEADEPRRGEAALRQAWARSTSSSSSTRSPRAKTISVYWHGKDDKPDTQWLGPLQRAARPVDEAPRRREADQRRRRVLARRREEPDAPAHLRDRVRDAGGARRSPEDARRSARARSPQARQRARALHVPRVGAGDAVSSCRAARSSTTSSFEYVRELYAEYGYEEVVTPQIFDRRLFETSGHLPNYRENMYFPATPDALDERARAQAPGSETPKASLALGRSRRLETVAQKPMNCPGHCLIFGQRQRSYRELPWRVADFGRLHRFERGGVVHGLTRVRSFCAGRRAHLLHAGASRRARSSAFNRLLFEVYRPSGSRTSRDQAGAPSREAHRHGRAVGPRRERRSPTCFAESKHRLRDARRAKAPSTDRRSSST